MKKKYVYFIQVCRQNGPIKIGISANPEERLRQLQTGNPDKLKLVKVIEGNQELERKFHRQNIGFRCPFTNEWFTPNPRLEALINN